MKVFVPENWERLRSELSKLGRIVEVRKGYGGEECCAIVGKGVSVSVGEANLREVLEYLADIGFDFAALLGFDAEIEGLERGFGFKIPRADSVEDVGKAPEIESLRSLMRKLKSDPFAAECGAIAIFVGFVRKISGGKEVEMMQYEAYEERLHDAVKMIEEGLAEKYDVRVRIYHKRGLLLPGEDIVYVLVMGRHRKDVWEPLREAVEKLKTELPIWKKEIYANGETWVHDKEG